MQLFFATVGLMMSKNYLFTSESVAEGHPDKVCDRISDAIVDMYLRVDPTARVAVETLATTNKVVLAGEMRSDAPFSREDIIVTARNAIRDIGYAQKGFHWQWCDVDVLLLCLPRNTPVYAGRYSLLTPDSALTG